MAQAMLPAVMAAVPPAYKFFVTDKSWTQMNMFPVENRLLNGNIALLIFKVTSLNCPQGLPCSASALVVYVKHAPPRLGAWLGTYPS